MTMRNDASRLRIALKDPRRPRAVVASQGLPLLDADIDHQARHAIDRVEIETVDSLGSPGRLLVPAGHNGFRATAAPAAITIAAGHAYLDGWLLENGATCTLATQPHPRTEAVAVPGIVALKTLIRYVHPVEDPVLHDPALGDAQASGRSLVDWQVFQFPLPGGSPVTCATVAAQPDWVKMIAPSSGTLAFNVATSAPSTDPCSLTPGGGYTRLENLLYRIEVHGGVPRGDHPTVDGPRFGIHQLQLKLSRRNASLMAAITAISGAEITVTPPALDPRAWFAPGQYAEIVSIHDDVDPRRALTPLSTERMFRIATATDDRVTLEETGGATVAGTGAVADGTWFLRLWDAFPDGSGVVKVSAPNPAAPNTIDLGDGLSLQLGGGAAGTFRRGDYWVCAARADGTIDWPAGQLVKPHGPETRYAPVAVLSGSSTSPSVEDCRIPFATLSDRTLHYLGGDGQSVFASKAALANMVQLPARARVCAMRGRTPVPNALVRWSLPPAAVACLVNGMLCNSGTPRDFPTDSNGLCEVLWSIDGTQPTALHQIQAQLVTAPGETTSPPVLFSATFQTAERTIYRPGACSHLANADDVQEALDTLCLKISEKPRYFRLTNIILHGVGKDLVSNALILNGLEDLPPVALMKGIEFMFDTPDLKTRVKPFDPVVEVELDLPVPGNDAERGYWTAVSPNVRAVFGTHRVRLDGTVTAAPPTSSGAPSRLLWMPSQGAMAFLSSAPDHVWGHRNLGVTAWPQVLQQSVLCRIRLRSALLWAVDRQTGERLCLNAEHLGTSENQTARELLVGELDPQRAGDLDMFVYLKTELRAPGAGPTVPAGGLIGIGGIGGIDQPRDTRTGRDPPR